MKLKKSIILLLFITNTGICLKANAVFAEAAQPSRVVGHLIQKESSKVTTSSTESSRDDDSQKKIESTSNTELPQTNEKGTNKLVAFGIILIGIMAKIGVKKIKIEESE